ncbi:Hpt domain-containing protein [candidate division KSB1 bacterium]|nr:Hpt domain-containing protein [candidate division KSB1 bacterium]
MIEPDCPRGVFRIPQSLDPAFLRDFQGEAAERLARAAIALTTLARDPSNEDALNATFRAFHTMKGISSFLGLTPITHLAHLTESCLLRVRDSGEVEAEECVSLAAESLQLIRYLITAIGELSQAGAWEATAEYSRLEARLVELGDALNTSSRRQIREAREARRQRIEQLIEQTEATVEVLRPVAVHGLLERLEPLVRGLALRLNKQLKLTIKSEAIEIDHALGAELGDALVHLLRNAVDHGIEPVAERERSGKPPVGTIEIRATRQAGYLVLEVQDDGCGIAASDRQHLGEPGYSTSAAVTEISGRGMGLNAVISAMEALGGAVEVESEAGRGLNVRLRLPLG